MARGRPGKEKKVGRPRLETVGNMGCWFEVLKRIGDSLLDFGGDDDDLARIRIEGSDLPRRIAELIVDDCVREIATYEVPADYNGMIWHQVAGAVGLNFSDDGATIGIPVSVLDSAKSRIHIKGLFFERRVDWDRILNYRCRHNLLLPVTLEHQFAFAGQFGKAAYKYHIANIDCRTREGFSVVILRGGSKKDVEFWPIDRLLSDRKVLYLFRS